MKQKRAPGGGRKPRGPFKENRARLSLRVTPDIRRALVAWAKARKLSLSQAAQSHLQKSLSRFFHPRPDIIVLTEMIARVIQDVERTTEAEWGQSAYTTAAIRGAIDSLLRHWGAPGDPKVPLQIKELAKEQPDNYAKQFQEPTEVGSWAAGRLILEIEARGLVEGEDLQPHQLPPDAYEPREWQHYRTILRHLGPRMRHKKPR
jgi:hypothetical protein